MITMQELAEKFKKQAGIVDTSPVSPRLTHSCERWRGLCNLLQIEQNFIFFSSKKGVINAWRNNLLWQLSKQCLSIAVLQDMEQAERDFVNLLALESKIPAYRLKSLLFKKGEKDLLAKIIPFLESFYITWNLNSSIESDRKNRIFFSNTSWDQLPPASFWKQAKEKGQVVLCFVETPSKQEDILPKFTKDGSHIGFLEVEELQKTPNHVIISLSLYNKTLEEKILFDFDFYTGLLSKVEKI